MAEESRAYDHLWDMYYDKFGDEPTEIFLELCNDYGVEVKQGTGRIMRDGKEIDIVSEIKDAFPRPKMDVIVNGDNVT